MTINLGQVCYNTQCSENPSLEWLYVATTYWLQHLTDLIITQDITDIQKDVSVLAEQRTI